MSKQSLYIINQFENKTCVIFSIYYLPACKNIDNLLVELIGLTNNSISTSIFHYSQIRFTEKDHVLLQNEWQQKNGQYNSSANECS
jgi:hypothetical protein